MKNKVLLFGMLAEAVGQPSVEIGEVADVDSLRKRITTSYPVLDQYPFAIALNKKVVNANQPIKDGDELALLPPFAGG